MPTSTRIKNPQPARGVSAVDGTTKAKIERAAISLFAESGVDGVSTREIAGAGGISEGAIYRYYSGKDDLARSLMLAIHNRLTEMIRVASSETASVSEAIDFMVTHYCRIADDDWALFRYHILHLHAFPGLSKTPSDSPLGAAAELIKSAMDEGRIDKGDPALAASMALGVVLQTAQSKVLGFVDGPLSDHTDDFAKAVKAVLGVKAGG